MLRLCVVALAGLMATGEVAAATWADGMFVELNKDFGSVPRGPALQHVFQIKNNTQGPVNIANVRVSCGCVTASATKSTLAPGEEGAITASMDTLRFTGHKNVTIFVLFDRPAIQEVRLWVQANGRDDVAVRPESLAFGTTKKGEGPTQAVTFTFYGTRDARIEQVSCESNYIQPAFKEVSRRDSEATYQITAKLREDAPVGKWFADLWVKTNVANMPRVRIPLTVEVESALSVTPASVAFNQVQVGKDAERKIIVRGLKPFKITGFEGGDGQLAIKSSTEESKPVHVVTIKLSPKNAGTKDWTIKVLTDLKEDNTIDFRTTAVVSP